MAVSPSLVAAKNVNVNRDFLDEGERKVGDDDDDGDDGDGDDDADAE